MTSLIVRTESESNRLPSELFATCHHHRRSCTCASGMELSASSTRRRRTNKPTFGERVKARMANPKFAAALANLDLNKHHVPIISEEDSKKHDRVKNLWDSWIEGENAQNRDL